MEETISGPCIENLNGEDLNELTHLKKNTDIDAVKQLKVNSKYNSYGNTYSHTHLPGIYLT